MKVFEQALSMMKLRALAQPNDGQRLHDLALAHERMGGAQESLKDDAAAARSYAEMARLFEHVKADEATAAAATLAQDHAVAHERLGDLARKRGDAELAREEYARGVSLLKQLPACSVAQRRLAVLAGKLGAVDTAKAAQHFEHELALWSALLASDADDVELIAGTAVAHGHMASVRSGADAVREATTQADAFIKLTLQEPLRVDWQRQAAVAEHQLGVALEADGKLSEAVAAYRRLHESKRDEAAARLRLAAGLLRMKSMDESRAEARLVLVLLEGDADKEAAAWRATALELAKLGRE
jgi:tetratricopeptide (TPR) repeat protein